MPKTCLVIVHSLLLNGTTYNDVGGNYFDEQGRQRMTLRVVRRLEAPCYKVTLEAAHVHFRSNRKGLWLP